MTHPSLDHTSHRPWPVPASAWRWRQTWHDLLFAHWQVPVASLRPHVPDSLSIDTRDGAAWLGLVPFTMSGITLRGLPPAPWLSSFTEMNLRTYVTMAGKPGVWFLRMDASRALAVWAARMGLGLPYVWSAMRVRLDGDDVHYRSRRGNAIFDATYSPSSSPMEAPADSLEAFLTERYCLYTVRRRRMVRVDIHHRPWPLQQAVADVRSNTIAEAVGVPAAREKLLLHFAKRLDVIGWRPEAV